MTQSSSFALFFGGGGFFGSGQKQPLEGGHCGKSYMKQAVGRGGGYDLDFWLRCMKQVFIDLGPETPYLAGKDCEGG